MRRIIVLGGKLRQICDNSTKHRDIQQARFMSSSLISSKTNKVHINSLFFKRRKERNFIFICQSCRIEESSDVCIHFCAHKTHIEQRECCIHRGINHKKSGEESKINFHIKKSSWADRIRIAMTQSLLTS